MKKIVLFLILIFITFLYAQQISLTGTVTNTSGQPLSGVIVKLLAALVSDTTDANGKYSLSGVVSVLPNNLVNPKEDVISYQNNKFIFNIQQPSMLCAKIYSLNGKQIANLYDGYINKGEKQIPFSFLNNGKTIYFLKVVYNNQKYSFKILPNLNSTFRLLQQNNIYLKKTAAVDWITATKSGYASHLEQLSVLTGVKDIVLNQAGAAPNFGPNAHIYDPSMNMTTIQNELNSVFQQQESAQFGSGRHAFLFKPGTYNVDVNVGFYTEVLGLGLTPDAVSINGQVHSEADWMGGNATCTFWRSTAGVSVTPPGGTNRWATSQATPFRRMHIKGNLVLDDGGWSSGGFIADSKIDGSVNSGSQQQYFLRNSNLGSWNGGNWNMMFVGVVNPPSGSWPSRPYTVIPKTPIIAEKPFLVFENNSYYVMVPELRKDSTLGITWANEPTKGELIPIDLFYIAIAGTDNATTINAALAQGKNLLITPGNYRLDASIKVTRPNTIVLGIGLPSLIPEKGTPAIEVSDVDGVRLGGILCEATTTNSPSLVVIGEPGSTQNHKANPTILHDVFCRAGGAFNGLATCFLTINSNDVIVDHVWLWRADHGTGAGWNSNKNANGLVVNGNDVTVYGNFTEHTQEYQTLWNGNGGRNYFYQCEMPYDPPDQASWMRGNIKGYPGYKVADAVNTHEAWAIGVYCVFHNSSVVSENGIEAPNKPGIKMWHLFTINLGGNILHVVSGVGGSAPSKVDFYPPQQ
jgi:hypothetical protein